MQINILNSFCQNEDKMLLSKKDETIRTDHNQLRTNQNLSGTNQKLTRNQPESRKNRAENKLFIASIHSSA